MTNSRKDAANLLAQLSKKSEAKTEVKAEEKAKVESESRDGVGEVGAKQVGKSEEKAGTNKVGGKAKAAKRGSTKAGGKGEVKVDPLVKQPKEQLNTTVDPRVKDAILVIQLDVKKSGAKKPKMGEVLELAVFSLLEARGLSVD